MGDNLGSAVVQISLAELDELRAGVRGANERAAQLEAQLRDARSADPSGRVASLGFLARDLLKIVRFAIANLPPSEIPKWPWQAVEAVADRLQHLPDHHADDEVFAGVLREFRDEIRDYELARGRKKEAQIESAPTLAELSASTTVAIGSESERRQVPRYALAIEEEKKIGDLVNKTND